MKRYGNLFDKICEIENLRKAHHNARKKKSFYSEVKTINSNEDFYFSKIQNLLFEGKYKTSKYETFKKIDQNKEREIYKLPYYPDRIVQWAILQVIQPILEKKLISDTYSAIPNKGIHYGLKRIKKALQNEEATMYCLKFDIKKYYPSINHSILKEKYYKIFKDKKLLKLIFEIIDSVEMTSNTGIPIGNYLSQWSANIFLSEFDHWVKDVKKIKYYFRYMDDIVIFDNSKTKLHIFFKEIKEYLFKSLKLSIKSNWQVFPTNIRGVDFLGYRIFKDYTLLRKSTCTRLKRKMKYLSKKNNLNESDLCSIQSYNGWLKWCNSFRLKRKYLEAIL
jgi:RNA-directed DNA polymerase